MAFFNTYEIGDLVHIPQAVLLVDCDNETHSDPQLTIPMRVVETESPAIGVVTASSKYGYLRVLVDGEHWSVRDDSIYRIKGGFHD